MAKDLISSSATHIIAIMLLFIVALTIVGTSLTPAQVRRNPQVDKCYTFLINNSITTRRDFADYYDLYDISFLTDASENAPSYTERFPSGDIQIVLASGVGDDVFYHECTHLGLFINDMPVEEQHAWMYRNGYCFGGCPQDAPMSLEVP